MCGLCNSHKWLLTHDSHVNHLSGVHVCFKVVCLSHVCHSVAACTHVVFNPLLAAHNASLQLMHGVIHNAWKLT